MIHTPDRTIPFNSVAHLLAIVLCLTLIESNGYGEWKKHVIKAPGKSMVSTAIPHDFNDDGHVDIISSYDGGVYLLRGPDWEPLLIHRIDPANSRTAPRPECLHSCLLDVDGDGDLDYCGSNLTVFWLECPDDPFESGAWTYRTIDDEILGTHCLLAEDIDGDNKKELIANSWCTAKKTSVPESIVFFDIPSNPQENKPWPRYIVADKDAPGGSHYIGFGDINGDGRPDICNAAKGGGGYPGGEWFAWWEQPSEPRKSPWKKHLIAANQAGASHILPVDINQDAEMDVVVSKGHDKGVMWLKGPSFNPVVIDEKMEGPHTLILADLDGDEDLDVSTCSRLKHGKFYWYENIRNGERFKRHLIGKNQAAYDLRSIDMDNDKDLDLIVAGQGSKNIVWFENPGKDKQECRKNPE